ncbi:MFS domain-containing protein [Aphelenchoides besseyi]|nr:MFS domain-containing protein [Aphelenchoides besseyi]
MFAPSGKRLRFLALFGAVATFTNFLEGYSSSYPNTAADSFQSFINGSYVRRNAAAGLTEWQFTFFYSGFLNIWFLAYLIGTLMTTFFTEHFGRKNSLLVANGCSLIGASISTSAIVLDTPELLFMGRVVAATSSGVSFGALILFLQETAPTNLRGQCSFLSEVSFLGTNVVGMAFGMNVLLGRDLFLLLAVAMIPVFLGVLIMIPLKETPKHLLIKLKDRKAAAVSVRYYQGDKVNVDRVLNEMLKEESMQKADLMNSWQATAEVFRRPSLRKAVLVGILSLQLCLSVWPIDYISTELLVAHFSLDVAQAGSLVFVSVNFISSLAGMIFVENLGRRPLLIYAGMANTLCLMLYIAFDRLAFYAHPQFRYGCVAALLIYAVSYGAALGPIAFFISTELVPQTFRALVQSIVFAFNTIITAFFSFLTLPMYRWIGIWSFIPLFIIPNCFSLVYLFLEMPETRNREIHEIVEELSSRRSTPTTTHLVVGASSSISMKTVDSNDTLSMDSNEERKQSPLKSSRVRERKNRV